MRDVERVNVKKVSIQKYEKIQKLTLFNYDILIFPKKRRKIYNKNAHMFNVYVK